MTGIQKIGRGTFTPLKQEHFTVFFHQYSAICEKILQKRFAWADPRLFVFDITAGCGVHPETGEIGSPLIITRTLQERGLDFHAYFIEQQPDNFAELSQRLVGAVEQSDASVITGICGDHVATLPRILEKVPQSFFGLLYYDFTTEDFNRSLAFLADLYSGPSYRKQLARTDCILYLAGTAIKRVRGAYPDRPSLLSYLRRIRKDHWLIREPVGANQYTFLLGTNWLGMPDYTKLGLHTIRKAHGRNIFLKVNHTDEEHRVMRDQTTLFQGGKLPYRNYDEYRQQPEYLAVRAEALARAGFQCERCEQRRATEVHHIIYPPWGTFDTTENLLAVCYACHCRIEGKHPDEGKAA